jgi:hypothetical protein
MDLLLSVFNKNNFIKYNQNCQYMRLWGCFAGDDIKTPHPSRQLPWHLFSPKTGGTYERVRRTMKRVFAGAAVKTCGRSKPLASFGYRKRAGYCR